MAATADCPSHCYCGWVNVSRCVRVYLFVCLWVASFAHFNANVGLPGSGVCRRHSLSAFAFAVASRVRARVACSFWDFGSSLCGGKEGRLRVGAASYWNARVCALVWVLKLLLSTAPIRSSSSNNKQGNRNNNYGHLGLGEIIFFFRNYIYIFHNCHSFGFSTRLKVALAFAALKAAQFVKLWGNWFHIHTCAHKFMYVCTATLVYSMQMESFVKFTNMQLHMYPIYKKRCLLKWVGLK